MDEKIRRFASQVVLVAAVFLVAAGMQVLAFSEPTQAPPGGNVDAPINTGSALQTKSGSLDILGALSVGSSANPQNFCLNGTCYTSLTSGGGGGSPLLENGISAHTEDQCANAGGSVVAAGGSGNVCRFNQSSCPAGWSQLGNWSTTSSGGYCADGSGKCSGPANSCTTGTHAWNNVQDTCPYYVYSGMDSGGFSVDPAPICDQSQNTCVNTSLSQIGCV